MNWKKVGIIVVAIAAIALVYIATAHPVGWGYGYRMGPMMGYGMPMMSVVGYCYDYENSQDIGNNTGFNEDYGWYCPMWSRLNQNSKGISGWFCPMWRWR